MDELIYGVVKDTKVMPDGTILGTVVVANPVDALRWNALLSIETSTKMGSLGYVTLTDNPVDPACHVYEIMIGAQATAPTDEPKPNHVRDAVRANR